MWGYCFLRSFTRPQIATHFSAELPKVESDEAANYNNILLALSIAFMVLPSYERRPPGEYENTPSLEIKKSQILGMGVSLTHGRECFGGKINGVFYRGLEFLSMSGSAYGVKASFSQWKRGFRLPPKKRPIESEDPKIS